MKQRKFMMTNNELEQIYKLVDSKTNFCFNAGAGSGKTYSLIKTITHLVDQYGEQLKKNNQRIMVITYTNAATNEIKERLGTTEVVDVSTIHERLWALIKRFKDDLRKYHEKKMIEEIDGCKKRMADSPYYSEDKLNALIDSDGFSKEYYRKIQDSLSQEFVGFFVDLLCNMQIKHTKKWLKEYIEARIKYNSFTVALELLRSSKKKKNIEYTPYINTDLLSQYKFSHDTLIVYANEMIKENKTLTKLIRDIYPFILMDEYQDADPLVIEILIHLSNCKDVVSGYFGDASQNIYEGRTGDRIINEDDSIVKVVKKENRRSRQNIVDIGNRIRVDNLLQVSFSKEDKNGVNKAYYCLDEEPNVETIDSFVSSKLKEIKKNDPKGKVACLLLRNDLVTKKMGFGSIYDFLSKTDYYKKNNRLQLANETLTNELEKMGKAQALIYKLISLMRINKEKGKHRLLEFLPLSFFDGLNYSALARLLNIIESIQGKTIKECFDSVSKISETDERVGMAMKNYFALPEMKDYYSYLLNALYPNVEDQQEVRARGELDGFLQLPISELLAYFNYVNRIFTDEVVYLTLHNSKGLEYDNVIVVLTNNFNLKKTYFHDFFASPKSPDFYLERNLLYVAVTRAKKNLYVLYFDHNYSDIKEGFENIFGKDVAEFH